MPVQFVYDTKCPVEELDSNTCSEIHFLHGKEGANCLSLWHKLVFTLWQKGNRADGGTDVSGAHWSLVRLPVNTVGKLMAGAFSQQSKLPG